VTVVEKEMSPREVETGMHGREKIVKRSRR
jgi:hypothetical protein